MCGFGSGHRHIYEYLLCSQQLIVAVYLVNIRIIEIYHIDELHEE